MKNISLQTITAQILCFAIAWTTIVPAQAAPRPLSESELLASNPQARIIHVSEAEYPQLAEQLRRQGYREAEPLRVAQNGSYSAGGDDDEQNGRTPTARDRRLCDDAGSAEGVGGSVHLNLDMHGAGGDSEGAVVLYIIIGTVVVVVWTLYLFKYLYDISMGYQPCRWSELGFSSSAISTNALQHAYFNGLTFQTGVQDGATEFGLSGELGSADIKLVERGTLRLNGLYWLLGPTLRWRISRGENPHYFQMQFMAGSTENAQIGLLAKADVALHLAVSERMNIGLSWGAMKMSLRETQGIITQQEQFYYLYGLGLGYRF